MGKKYVSIDGINKGFLELNKQTENVSKNLFFILIISNGIDRKMKEIRNMAKSLCTIVDMQTFADFLSKLYFHFQ